MQRAIQLAQRGYSLTQTNPMVGAVIIHGEKIIGEGLHRQYGEAHAEVHALRDVSKGMKSLLPQSTLYVTLEPCSIVGKTPSCARTLIEQNIGAVVIGTIDPNPKVKGKGIAMLKSAGIPISLGLMEKECQSLLFPFSVQQKKKRPFVHIKWAQSYDGYISKENEPTPISHRYLKFLTHKIRGRSQAILVGTNTILVDNPSLDNRYDPGGQPVKIILDRKNRIQNKNLKVFSSEGTTLGLGVTEHPLRNHFDDFIPISPDISIDQVLSLLYQHGIGSLMVEGGRSLLQSFIDEKLWDRATVIKSPLKLKQGIKAPMLTGEIDKVYSLAGNLVNEIIPKK